MTDRKRNEIINEIIEYFDFERVHKAMKALDWKWHDSNQENKVPTIGHVVSVAKDQLIAAYDYIKVNKSKEYCTGTGGFQVKGFYNPVDDRIWLKLEFVVSEWDADICLN